MSNHTGAQTPNVNTVSSALGMNDQGGHLARTAADDEAILNALRDAADALDQASAAIRTAMRRMGR